MRRTAWPASSSEEKMPRLFAELHAQFATLRDTLLPKLLSGEVRTTGE
ncbi:MAG: hypothetical protein ABMA26_05670 [Limisphaerales bacterium]